MASKTEVVVSNHDFEEGTSQEGSPSAANPELGSSRMLLFWAGSAWAVPRPPANGSIVCLEEPDTFRAPLLIEVLECPTKEGLITLGPA
jgi:hypothetical protein